MQEHGFNCNPTGRRLKGHEVEIEHRIEWKLRHCAELRSPGLSRAVYRGTDRRAVFGIYRNSGLLQRLTTTCCRLWKILGSSPLSFLENASRFRADCLQLPWLASGLLLRWTPGAWQMQQRRGDYMNPALNVGAGGSTRRWRTQATAAEPPREGCTALGRSLLLSLIHI